MLNWSGHLLGHIALGRGDPRAVMILKYVYGICLAKTAELEPILRQAPVVAWLHILGLLHLLVWVPISPKSISVL
jgi:hypothetical protein